MSPGERSHHGLGAYTLRRLYLQGKGSRNHAFLQKSAEYSLWIDKFDLKLALFQITRLELLQ